MNGDKIADLIEELIEIKIRHHAGNLDAHKLVEPDEAQRRIGQSLTDHNRTREIKYQLASLLGTKGSLLDTHIYDIPMRVLIYKEDGEFVAHALEMDLLGHGATHENAMDALMEMIFCQISFAHQKKDAGLLVFPAEPEVFERWESARESALRKEVIEDKPIKLKYIASCLSITGKEIKDIISKRRRFTPVLEGCA